MDRNVTLMTFDQKPCQLVAIWLMILTSEPCHSGCMFMLAKFKKDRQNLTILTLDREPCQLVPIWLMTLPSQHCHTGGVFMLTKSRRKKRQAGPSLNDFRPGTLSIGLNMINDSLWSLVTLVACVWKQNKKKTGKTLP